MKMLADGAERYKDAYSKPGSPKALAEAVGRTYHYTQKLIKSAKDEHCLYASSNDHDASPMRHLGPTDNSRI